LDLEKFYWSEEKKDIDLRLAQQSCVVLDESWMIMYGGKMNSDTGRDLVASTDMFVVRLSGESVRSCINKKKDLPTSMASVQS